MYNYIYIYKGTKEKVIIDTLGNRSNAQRQVIKDRYKAMFGRV